MCEHCNYLPVALKRRWVPNWLWLCTMKLVLWRVWPIKQIITTSDPDEMRAIMHGV
jgi:hypothetical protein